MRGWSVLRALGGQVYPAPGAELFATHEAAMGYVRAQQQNWQERAGTRPAIYLLCEAIQGDVPAEEIVAQLTQPSEMELTCADFAARLLSLEEEAKKDLGAHMVYDPQVLREALAEMKVLPVEAVPGVDPRDIQDLSGRIQNLKQEINFLRAELQELQKRMGSLAPAKPANGRRKENKVNG